MTGARLLAESLGAELHAVVIGAGAALAAGGLDAYGAERIHLVRHDLLIDYGPDAWAESLVRLAETSGAGAVIATGTDRGNEVMAQVGARTDLAMVANCLEIEPDGNDWLMTRVRWGGSLRERARLSAPRQAGDPRSPQHGGRCRRRAGGRNSRGVHPRAGRVRRRDHGGGPGNRIGGHHARHRPGSGQRWARVRERRGLRHHRGAGRLAGRSGGLFQGGHQQRLEEPQVPSGARPGPSSPLTSTSPAVSPALSSIGWE